MSLRTGRLRGVIIFERPTFHDDRGFFHEVFQTRDLESVLGDSVRFVQINHSRSRKNVLRGLHAEDWEKLVYAPRGTVFTALADLRPESPTFGQTETFLLGEMNASSVFIPRGIGHGYLVLSEDADYVYQVSAYYDGSDTHAVAWDDPDLAINWPTHCPVLSERDRLNPTMRELFPDRYLTRSPFSTESIVGSVSSRLPRHRLEKERP